MSKADSPSHPISGRKKPKLRRWLASVLVILLAFGLGLGVGQGRLSLSSHAVSGSLPSQLDYSSVNKVYQALKNNYDGKLTTAQLLSGLKSGLAESTKDPYTEFFTADEAKQFTEQLNNSFTGIGAELGKDASGNIVIISPIKGFPAAKVGLKPQDAVVSINGNSTSNMAIGDAVDQIRGTAGTPVTLKILRNKTDSLSFKIVREEIKLPSVTTKTLPGNIGYMQISTFANDTSSLAQQAANKFKSEHVKGIILDLRSDPGGLLDAAVNVSSLWLPEGQTVLQEKRGGAVVNTYTATGDDQLHGLPTVVLIDGGSASASEITAGALHDNGAARLIGSKSYGKGSVQQIQDFADGSELKVTVARWYRPDGQNIDKKGITPDQTVKLSDQDLKASNDTQLKAAEVYLTK